MKRLEKDSLIAYFCGGIISGLTLSGVYLALEYPLSLIIAPIICNCVIGPLVSFMILKLVLEERDRV